MAALAADVGELTETGVAWMIAYCRSHLRGDAATCAALEAYGTRRAANDHARADGELITDPDLLRAAWARLTEAEATAWALILEDAADRGDADGFAILTGLLARVVAS